MRQFSKAMSQADLSSAIAELELESFRDELNSLARPCWAFESELAQSPVSPGESKIGGIPLVPEDFQWPFTKNSVPMHFLCRLVEKDVRKLIPEFIGNLLFFADWDSEPEGRVVHVPRNSSIEPCLPKRESSFCLFPLRESKLKFYESIALPENRDGCESLLYSRELLDHGATPSSFWGDRFMHTKLDELISRHFGRTQRKTRPHRLGGYVLFTQNHPAFDAERRFTPSPFYNEGDLTKDEFSRRSLRWKALVSFEDDDDSGIIFGDSGNCGFLITDDALSRQAFDECFFFQDNC
jgi:uncharacterized protein YwqG